MKTASNPRRILALPCDARTRSELESMLDTIDALAIILTCPLWPRRELLSPSGALLHDAIVEDAKRYARLIVSGEPEASILICSKWSALAASFMEETLIHDPYEPIREANQRMLGVYKHYMDAYCKWSLISR